MRPENTPRDDSTGERPPRGVPVSDRRRTDPDVLTVDEDAALLRVDRKSTYDSIRRGELPASAASSGSVAPPCYNGSPGKFASRVQGQPDERAT